MNRVNLGDRVKDVLTGIEGLVYGITNYSTGCDHIGIKRSGTNSEGQPFDLHWVDEPVCKVLKTNALKLPGDVTEAGNNGGPALHRFGRR